MVRSLVFILSAARWKLSETEYSHRNGQADNSVSLPSGAPMQYLFPLLTIVIWSANNVVNKLTVGVIFPAEIGFYRWLLAGILFTPFLLRPVIKNWAVIKPNLKKIAVLGVLGMAVYQSLAYFAASMTTATNMGIILSLMPMIALGDRKSVV